MSNSVTSFAQLKNNRKAQAEALTKQLKDQNTSKNYDDGTYWQPTVDKAGNGLAIIRFLPAPAGEEDAMVRWWEHSFKVEYGDKDRWYIEKCLTTIKQDDPVVEHTGELYESGDKAKIALGSQRKRKLYYCANILVVDDKGSPENNGKVFRYKFGKKIFDKINEAMNPSFEGEESLNPFDMWDGANFKLMAKKVDGQRNYDSSQFLSPEPISDDDDVIERIWKQTHSLQSEIALDKFKSYDELKQRLNWVLGINTKKSAANTDSEDDRPKAKTNKISPKRNPNSVPWNTDDDDDDDNNSNKEEEPKQSSKSDTDDDDDDDMSFFRNMAKKR